MIFVPKLKIIEPKSELVAGNRFSGEYKLIATNARTGKQRVLADWFPNVILDVGLDRAGTTSALWTVCSVGSGNSAPLETQTSLDNRIASTSSILSSPTSNLGVAPWYTQQTVTYRFAQGAAAGNLSEIAVGGSTDGSNLWSRALILDGGGQPTTITVLADEFLDAVYRIRNYPPYLNDVVSELTIDGITTTVTARVGEANDANLWISSSFRGFAGGGDPTGSAARHNVYSGVIGSVTGTPSGTSATGPGAGNQTYTSQSLFRDYTLSWGLTQGNVGGVRSLHSYLGSSGRAGYMQYQFDPPIAKDSTKTMVFTLRHSWGRYVV